MNIKYKLIEHERIGDAPFIGALISSCDCKYNCKNCFNQHIKKMPTIIKSASNIISIVKSNIFNKGIILAGLEWGLQIDEAILLADESKKNGLLSILYTGNDSYIEDYHSFDYVKIGKYIEALRTINHYEHGVVLASSNQHILKKGIDY